jgi:hypothetical protein
MSRPRFVPRLLCVPSRDFGRRLLVRWVDETTMSESARDQLGAAKMQHQLAYAIRNAIERGPDGTVKAHADSLNVDAARFGRMLRGEVIMRLEDIASARRHLGGEFDIALNLNGNDTHRLTARTDE